MNPDGSTLISEALAEALMRRGALGVTFAADYRNSVSAGVVRGVLDGRLFVGVGEDYKQPVSAFTDLIDLHLRGWGPDGRMSRVPLNFGGGPGGRQAAITGSS